MSLAGTIYLLVRFKIPFDLTILMEYLMAAARFKEKKITQSLTFEIIYRKVNRTSGWNQSIIIIYENSQVAVICSQIKFHSRHQLNQSCRWRYFPFPRVSRFHHLFAFANKLGSQAAGNFYAPPASKFSLLCSLNRENQVMCAKISFVR